MGAAMLKATSAEDTKMAKQCMMTINTDCVYTGCFLSLFVFSLNFTRVNVDV